MSDYKVKSPVYSIPGVTRDRQDYEAIYKVVSELPNLAWLPIQLKDSKAANRFISCIKRTAGDRGFQVSKRNDTVYIRRKQ